MRRDMVGYRDGGRGKVGDRVQRMQTPGQRLAVVGWRAGTTVKNVFRTFGTARKAELVYRRSTGRLAVVILSFGTRWEREAAQEQARDTVGQERMRVAYSRQTRNTRERQVVTLYREQCV